MNDITLAQQMLVGKISATENDGQIKLFPLPQSFDWLIHFDADEIAEFFTELLITITNSTLNGDWSAVATVISDWKETAMINADEELSRDIEIGMAELEAGLGVSWEEVKQELAL